MIKRWIRRVLYLFAFIMIAWTIAVQSGCLTMRTPDSEWEPKMSEKGQNLTPRMFDIEEPNGRMVHAIGVEPEDSLPAVVFVHGSPGSADAYLDYLADTVLSQYARMYTVDRPGFGYTSGFGKPEKSIRAQAEAVCAVLDSIRGNSKAILVGHSLGAPVVACMAMHFPEKVGGIIMIGGSIDPELEPKPWWQPVVHNPPIKWIIPKSMWTSNAEIIPLRHELEDMLPRWKDIKCPAAMVHAYNDRLVPFGNVRFAKEHLVNVEEYRELIFEKGDHFVVWSRKEAVRELIIDFLGML